MLSRCGFVGFDSLQPGKVTSNRIVILVAETIWDVLLGMFCSCVGDFYSPCPYGRDIYV